MKIHETYIVWHNGIFKKMYRCLNHNGVGVRYYMENDNGFISEITIEEAHELMKVMK